MFDDPVSSMHKRGAPAEQRTIIVLIAMYWLLFRATHFAYAALGALGIVLIPGEVTGELA